MHGAMPPTYSQTDAGHQFWSAVTQLRDYVQMYQELGMDGVVCTTRPQTPLEVLTLESLETTLRGCQRCKLHASRTKIVFGTGNPRATLMFLGEGPGEHEDQQGKPFVGPAGELLTKIIEAIKLRRDEVYITNVVKCRPPDNRAPKPEEIAACEPFLLQQIDLIHPKIICTLGASAAHALLKTNESISRLRGRFHDYRGINVMPTYHPEDLLRNPGEKRLVWQDMQAVKKAYADIVH